MVLDPGHGGPIDTGAVGSNGLPEKEVNLKVALATASLLEEEGISTVLTRTADYPIPIPTRAEYADLMGARALISIHHNAPAAPASDVPGIEVFVQQAQSESARLGGLLYDRTMARLGELDVDWDRAPDAGVMTVINSDGEDAYGMVRRPATTSVLLELGYIANPAEAAIYLSPRYIEAASRGVAEAVVAFLNTDGQGAALVEGRNFDPQSGVGKDQCIDVTLDEVIYPNVVKATVSGSEAGYDFSVTVSSPYDTPDRYADAWRVVGEDGTVYGVRELVHDHANEQPFTRSLTGVVIPESVDSVIIEARDQTYGWGGGTVVLDLP